MARPSALTFVALLPLMIAGALAGCSDPSGLHTGAALAGDGGLNAAMCMRDPRETLLASLDRACTLSSECPHGAFCDVAVGGFCNFQCFDDSECPNGKLCDCFGRCAGPSPDAGDAGPAPDPTCPRNATVIMSAATGPTGVPPAAGARLCQFDDTCPLGTNCNIQTGRCGYACLNDAQCPAADGGARVCDCFGRCGAPGGARPPLATKTLPTVTLVPSVIGIPRPVGTLPVKPSFTARAVQVRVEGSLSTMTGSGQGPQVAINVTAGRFIDVRCPKQFTIDPTPVFGKSCKLVSWGWTQQGERFVATQSIDVQPSAETPAAGETPATLWNVDLQSADLSSPGALSIQYSNVPAEGDPSQWQVKTVVQGGYRGVLQLTINDEASDVTPDGLPRSTVVLLPVTAIGDGAGLLNLYDPTRVLSPSGIFALRTDSSALFEDFISNSSVASGSMLTIVSPGGPPLEAPGTKRLRGTFGTSPFPRTLPPGSGGGGWSGRFVLTPDPTVLSCTTGTTPTIACPAGLTCNFGFCTTGPALNAVPPSQIPDSSPTFTHPGLSAWANPTALTTIRQALTQFPTVNHVEQIVCQTSFPGLNGTLDGGIDRFSGDVMCNLHSAQATVPFAEQVAIPLPFLEVTRLFWGPQNALMAKKLSGQDILGSCLAELATPVPPVAGGTGLATLGASFFGDYPLAANPKRCFSPGNFYTALTLALDSQIAGADRPKLYQNLLRQWLEMHSFIARQGLEELGLDTVLASANDTTDLSPNKLTHDRLLDVLEQGLWLVLQQQAQAHLEKIAVNDYVNPDYRPGALPTLEAKPEHEQPAGFVPALLEASAAYLKVVEANLRKVNGDTYEASLGAPAPERVRALRRYGDAIRITTAMESFAEQTYRTAATTCAPGAGCQPPWEKRWREALNLFLAQRSRTLELGDQLSLVRNPLGIDENDLPLFFGDPQGTNSRFFASSDYLIDKWATPAIAETRADLSAARDAWVQARNSRVQEDLLTADRDRRLEEVGRLYGKPVIDNCGLQQYGGVAVEAKDVFDIVNGSPLNTANCFVDRSCAVDPTTLTDVTQVSSLFKQLASNGGAAAVNYKLCIWKALAPQLTLPSDLQACIGNNPSTWQVLLSFVGLGSFTCNGTLFDAATLWRDYGENSVFAADRARAEETCDAQFPHFDLPVPSVDPGCYHGRLGEAMSRIAAAKQEVAAALAHLETTEVTANEKAKLCILLETDNGERASAQKVLDQVRDNWAKTKDVARDVKRVTGAIQGAIAGAQEGGAIGGPVGAAVGAVIGGLGSFFGGGPDNAVQKADDQLRLAEADYQTLVSRQDRAEQTTACWGEFNVAKSQIDGDIAVIKARGADVNSVVLEFANLLRETDQSLIEGRAAVKREKNRPFGGYAFHFWYDEKVERFKRDFEWAKRLTYLSMRAVEYEFQQSLSLRQKILSAHHPDELDAAMLILQQERAGRSINRRRPEQSTLVVSVRDDVLKIADRSAITDPGERAYTPATRFMGRLRHPQYAVYDGNGQYLGQGISFPLDQTASESSSGVSLPNRCAERLWRVTATVQGDGLSPSEPGTTAFLLKRNTFASQWCEGLGDGSLRQVASVQPARMLFSPDSASQPADQGLSFTAAVLYPWFNIRRTEFYRQAYVEGASEELAGRGLYGDYILLFPKELLQTGFPLERVEDVLVRFDYLSVDDLASPVN